MIFIMPQHMMYFKFKYAMPENNTWVAFILSFAAMCDQVLSFKHAYKFPV